MPTFKEILQNHGIPVMEKGQHHHAHHGWIQFDCPWCSPGSGRYRMGYNMRGRYVSCWQCGGGHALVPTLARLLALAPQAVVELLGGVSGGFTKDEAPARGKLVLPKRIQPLQECHRNYLRERRFDPDLMVKLWDIEGIGLSSRLAWRIFIPARLEDKVVSWTTRSISDEVNARYISASHEEESYPLKELLYGEQYCRHAIIINEGPLDAWAVGPGAVATCGLSYTRAQLLRMVQYPMRVVLFDNEPEAQRRAQTLCADLAVFPGETFNVTFDAKDASRATKREIRKLRESFLE